MHDFIEGPIPHKQEQINEDEVIGDETKISVEFFKGLSESSNLDIFTKESVRALIKFKWPLIKEWTIKKLMIPYMILLVILTIYTTGIYYEAKEGEPLPQRLDPIFKILLILFSLYFLKLEWEQLLELKASYFTSVWNFLDVFPPSLAMILIVWDIFTFTSVTIVEPALWSIVAFLMWLKFLYFFRIFEPTAYLIRMIIEVAIDMRAFMIVLIVCIIAFGNAFLILSYENTYDDEEDIVIGDFMDSLIYSYMVSLGDFGDDAGIIAEDDPN